MNIKSSIKYYTITLILFTCFSVTLKAQINNDFFINDKGVDYQDTTELHFFFNNANFLRNHEFFNDFVKGYTALGFNFSTGIHYQVSEKFGISGGLHTLKYSGRDDELNLEPLFTFHYNPSEKFRILFGTIEGSVNHKLPEVMYEFERFLTDRVENGLQFLYTSKRLRADLWVDWDQFILEDDPFQEKFTIGLSANYNIIENASFFLHFPVGATGRHRGGQINAGEENIMTIINAFAGLKTGYKSEKFNIGFRGDCFLYEDNSPTPKQAYIDGYGLLPQLFFESKLLTVNLGYWYGRQFISALGNPIYQSASESKVYIEKPNREMITSNVAFGKRIHRDIKLSVRAQVYYDIPDEVVDYSFGFYLLYHFRRKI